MEFDQSSTDTSMGLRKEVIRFWWPWSHFQGHTGTLKLKYWLEKSLCAHFILNQWLEFYLTSTDTSLGHGKEVVRFWWPWPHFQGHYIIKTVKMSLVCTLISWMNRWNLTELAQIHHWDGGKGKKWLDFGDLDLIFKVTPTLWNSNFD